MTSLRSKYDEGDGDDVDGKSKCKCSEMFDPQTLVKYIQLCLDVRCVLAIYYVNIMCINRMTNTHTTHTNIRIFTNICDTCYHDALLASVS